MDRFEGTDLKGLKAQNDSWLTRCVSRSLVVFNPGPLPGGGLVWPGIQLGIYCLWPEEAGISLSKACGEQSARPKQAENEKKMPKLKTHSGAAKRFSKTGTGKIKRGQTKTRHILTSKSPKVKRKLGRTLLVSDGDYKKVARMIPYA
jgi:large subunit ribosomal protein L35